MSKLFPRGENFFAQHHHFFSLTENFSARGRVSVSLTPPFIRVALAVLSLTPPFMGVCDDSCAPRTVLTVFPTSWHSLCSHFPAVRRAPVRRRDDMNLVRTWPLTTLRASFMTAACFSTASSHRNPER